MTVETEEQLIEEILDLCEEADANGVEAVKISRSLSKAKRAWPLADANTVTVEELEEILGIE